MTQQLEGPGAWKTFRGGVALSYDLQRKGILLGNHLRIPYLIVHNWSRELLYIVMNAFAHSRDEFEMTSLLFVGALCCPVPCMVILCCRLCGKRVDCACLNCFSEGNCKCCCCQIEPRKFRRLPSQAEQENIASGICQCLACHQLKSYFYTR